MSDDDFEEPDVDRMDLAEYKDHVRSIAVEVMQEQDWCADGAEPYFRRLGLGDPPRKQSFVLDVPVACKLRLTFSEYTEKEAREKLAAWLDDAEPSNFAYHVLSSTYSRTLDDVTKAEVVSTRPT